MNVHEIILCAEAPSPPASGLGSVSLRDIHTGSLLASFKQTTATTHCTAVVESKNSLGGLVFSSQLDKPILNVYSFQKDQVSVKIVLPEKLSCIAVDNQGAYCVGATSQGRICLWEIASGIMYNSWDAHYRQINVLKFTHDGAAFLSGSEDSATSVWSVSRLLDEDSQNELPLPYCTLSDHTLPVTDIICGVGEFPTCRALTSSMDHSVKLWDISTKALLTTFQFPQPITVLAWQKTESCFFAASPDGSIHQMNLFRQREGKLGGHNIEAVGGAGIHDVIRIDDNVRDAQKKRLISIGEPITCMTISLTSTLLLIGTATGLIHLVDIASHQQLRTVSTHKGFSITHIQTMLKPLDLVGHVNLSVYMGNNVDARESIPTRPITAFQRMRDAKAREDHEISLMLPITTRSQANDLHYSKDELSEDHASLVQSTTTVATTENDTAALKSRVADLEGEVEHLKTQLGKAKGVNDVMWDTVVQRIILNEKTSQEGDDGERKRKRGRS
ncbi:hypothetical protein AMATHDRAFT_58182 [Amanita thiersii Skay4041]|uniref:Pre-rRNA-processing protein IPI3 n=1 Tax=Amanita thiersii Skay4041 TaxID=703135 RepID=A0A2A9NW26_9AGAR|nr:hypothetical protein AMATHDRAFT_58182 [Amanita thiersii Skay4041]